MNNIMNLFNKKIKEKTIFEKISEHPICNNYSDLKFNENKLCWLNPSNQISFNFGWFNEKDLNDWLNGTGNIVKGKTEKEKKKFWDYALFLKNYNNQIGHLMLYNFKYFNLVNEKYNPNVGYDLYFNNSLIIMKNNKEEIIKKIFGSFVNRIKNQFTYMGIDDILNENRKTLYGVSKTLILLGCGYFGASNTPKIIENLSWFQDVVISKAYYLYLLDENVQLPDFNFILNYKN
jgi:hypothetical protein